jgi:dienelactone hydrolase
MRYLSNAVLFGTLAAVVTFPACGGEESAQGEGSAQGGEGEPAMINDKPPPSPEAVAAAEALTSMLATSEITLLPTQRGLVDIEYTQPIRRTGRNTVTTTMRIRNQSPNAIAGFEISEVWYDENGNIVTGGQVKYREPIMPRQVIDVELNVPRDSDMERSNTEFTHTNGDVRQSLVPGLPDPPVNVELTASDGVNLQATYSSPGSPGPGMLLIHQCNMDRTSWRDMALTLVDVGVHVLTLDLRGFGNSGGEGMSSGFETLLQNSARDADMAFEHLVSQSGVDESSVGVGGASCGGMITADLAARQDGVKALMLLSSPPSEAAVENITNTPELAVFAAATEDDPVTVGVADILRGAVDASEHPNSIAKIYTGTEHGLPMFETNQDLELQLIEWLRNELLN